MGGRRHTGGDARRERWCNGRRDDRRRAISHPGRCRRCRPHGDQGDDRDDDADGGIGHGERGDGQDDDPAARREPADRAGAVPGDGAGAGTPVLATLLIRAGILALSVRDC